MEQYKSPTTGAEAWQQMSDLLDAEMPAGKGPGNNNRKYTVLLALLLISGCGLYKWFNNGSAAHENIIAVKHQAAVAKPDNEPKIKTGVTTSPKKEGVNIPVAAMETGLSNDKIFHKNTDNKHAKTVSAANMPAAKNTFLKKIKSSEQAPYSIINSAGNSGKTNAKTTLSAPEHNTIEANTAGLTTEPVRHNENPGINPENKAMPTGNTNDTQLLQVKKIKNKPGHKYHVGLEWGLPLSFGNTSLFKEVNAKDQPLTVFIPALYVGKNISDKSALYLSLNPYAQYFLNNRSVLHSGNYSIGAVSASAITGPRHNVQLSQLFTLSKITGIQAALQYEYHFTGKWSAGATLANTWVTTALVSEKITRDNYLVIKDSLYGVIQKDIDWQYLHKSFMSAKINVAYSFWHYQLGIAVSRPLSAVYKAANHAESVANAQLLFRWVIR